MREKSNPGKLIQGFVIKNYNFSRPVEFMFWHDLCMYVLCIYLFIYLLVGRDS